MTTRVFVIILFCLPLSAGAQVRQVNYGGLATPTQNNGTVTPMPQTSGGGGSGSNINKNAKEAASSGQAAQAMNMASAALMMAMCIPNTPMFPYACILGAASAAQSLAAGGAAKGAQDTADASTAQYGNNSGGGGGSSGSDGTAGGLTPSLQAEYSQIQAKLKNAGIKMSADGSTATLPDGSKISTSALGSADGMKGLGMSDQQISSLMAAQKNINDKVLKDFADKIQGLSADGGGGKSAGRPPTASASDFKFDPFAAMRAQGHREPASIVGLSRKLGSENVGVSSDSMFEMVSRQYKKKDVQNFFFKQ